MKKYLPSLLALVVIAASVVFAQSSNVTPDRTALPPEGHRPPPPSVLMLALDTNHDGELSADEIANAPAALRALDLNGDGKLDRDELRPPFPPPGCPPPPQG